MQTPVSFRKQLLLSRMLELTQMFNASESENVSATKNTYVYWYEEYVYPILSNKKLIIYLMSILSQDIEQKIKAAR